MTTVLARPRIVLIKEITGPIRATSGDEVEFELRQCSVNGVNSDGGDLTEVEAKLIHWVLRQALTKPHTATVNGKHVRTQVLRLGRELSHGTGPRLSYTVPSNMPNHALVAMAYVNSPSLTIAQWTKISATDDFQDSGPGNPALLKYPEIKDEEKLCKAFGEKWGAFAKALKDAGADVKVNSTLRSLQRAYMMHYATLLAVGAVKPWEVPDQITNTLGSTGEMGVEWTHTDDDGRVDLKQSQHAANQMKLLFEIAFPPALTSNHTAGNALDVSIRWSGTLTIKDKAGKEHKIDTTPRHGGQRGEPAGNAKLRTVAESYGVHKLLTDAPHWSVDGK